MDAQVRPAERGDADELARVHLSSWRWAYRGLLPDGYLGSLREDELAARWWRRLAAPDSDDAILVLEHEGVVSGFVTFGPLREDPTWLGHAAEINMLYLDPRVVGKGFGAELLRGAFDDLERGRCHWVVVWVLSKNQRARSFYERAGMKLDGGRRWDPFGDRAVPVVRYAKAINPVVDFDALCRPSRIR